jgi:hypothetical protein
MDGAAASAENVVFWSDALAKAHGWDVSVGLGEGDAGSDDGAA